MKKSGGYNLWKGRKIKVYSVNHRYLGIWEYDKSIYMFNLGKQKLFTPRFKQGKKKIHGYVCWWIPLSVAEKEGKNIQK